MQQSSQPSTMPAPSAPPLYPDLEPQAEAFIAPQVGSITPNAPKESTNPTSNNSSRANTPRNTNAKAAGAGKKTVKFVVMNSSNYTFQLDGEYFASGGFVENTIIDRDNKKRIVKPNIINPNGKTEFLLYEDGTALDTIEGLFWFVENTGFEHYLSVCVTNFRHTSMNCFVGKPPNDLKDEFLHLEKRQTGIKYALNNGNGSYSIEKNGKEFFVEIYQNLETYVQRPRSLKKKYDLINFGPSVPGRKIIRKLPGGIIGGASVINIPGAEDSNDKNSMTPEKLAPDSNQNTVNANASSSSQQQNPIQSPSLNTYAQSYGYENGQAPNTLALNTPNASTNNPNSTKSATSPNKKHSTTVASTQEDKNEEKEISKC